MDDFDGSGSSIEVVISGMETDIASLESRVTGLETVVNSNKVFESIALCGDIAASGPLYETILLSGDRTKITAYIQSGGSSGLGLYKQLGDGSGDLFDTTTLNTKKCNFKVYEKTTELLVCWDNSNRNSNEVTIDNECDLSGGFATPTANCTCK